MADLLNHFDYVCCSLFTIEYDKKLLKHNMLYLRSIRRDYR